VVCVEFAFCIAAFLTFIPISFKYGRSPRKIFFRSSLAKIFGAYSAPPVRVATSGESRKVLTNHPTIALLIFIVLLVKIRVASESFFYPSLMVFFQFDFAGFGRFFFCLVFPATI